MGRPSPKVLLEWTDPKTYDAVQVLEAHGVYVVCLDGQPIALRKLSKLHNDPPKSRRIGWANRGYARVIAARLNRLFRTDRFTVRLMTGGEEVER